MAPEERACEGVFMAFQYPVEIAGINNAYFLKAALNAVRKYRGQQELDAVEFMQLIREKAKLLEMDQAMLSRSVNEGFSGGEKKRNEIFQMAVLEPRLAILDETDSGLDIDALQDRLERRQRAAQPRPRDHRRHALSAAARTTSCPTSCTCCPTAASCDRAARSWRSSSRPRATAGWKPSWRERRPSHDAGRRTARDAAPRRSRRFAAMPAFDAGRPRRRRAKPRSTRFIERGFPTTRDEEWRTRTSRRSRDRRSSARPRSTFRAAAAEPFLFADEMPHRDRARERPLVAGAVVARRAAGRASRVRGLRDVVERPRRRCADRSASAGARRRSSISTPRSSRTASSIDVGAEGRRRRADSRASA